MRNLWTIWWALGSALTPMVGQAAENTDLAAIRREIQELRDTYEARIKGLEERLKKAEARTEKPPVAPPAVAAAVTPARTSNAFNPAISLILQGRYANLSQDPDTYSIAGFQTGGEIGPGKRGLSLSETELNFSANVDDKFFGNATLALTPENEAEVEEAYGLATRLPAGLTLKAGRFFSAIGYQNEHHQHAWDFIDAPLAYQAFLGGQFGNDGVQIKWVAPTPLFLELGAEVGNGENFPGTGLNKNGAGAAAITARLGGDIGVSTSWRAGLSLLRTRAEDREFATTDIFGNDALLSFNGRSRVGIADLVLKWAPDGNAANTHFKLQTEYFRGRETGELTFDADGALGLTNTDSYRTTQSGWYLQGVYQFRPRWRVGLRYDRLYPGSVDYFSNDASLETTQFNPDKTSFMIDWSPSEFSRLRLQAARDKSRLGVTDNQVFLQYIMSIGAHGGHKF